MVTPLSREILLERRQRTPEQSALWDKLSLSQKFATSSLNQYGYNLAFIRSSGSNNLAILLYNDEQGKRKSATVNSDGEIDTAPNIVVRN